MLRISQAILHVFDFDSGSTFFSEGALDLSNRATRSYVQRHLRKISSNAESKHGEFSPGSSFPEELRLFFAGQNDFVGFSVQIAQWFWEELRRTEDLEQCDLLVADFTDTDGGKVDGGLDDSGADAAFEGKGRRLFAVILLPRRQAFVHEIDSQSNEISRQDATLPNPTQKVESYVLVDADTMAIDFHDKERNVGGEARQIIPELFLQCSTEASSHEVIDQVTVIVRDIAEEYGLTPAVEVSRAKVALSRHADLEEVVAPAEVGREVFEDRPELARHYEERIAERQLPDEVPVRRGVANRLTKTHRIRTDTGIEISFPSDLADKPGYIDFVTGPDGRISINILNVASIENR